MLKSCARQLALGTGFRGSRQEQPGRHVSQVVVFTEEQSQADLTLCWLNTIAQSLPVTDELVHKISAITILVKYRILTPDSNESELLFQSPGCYSVLGARCSPLAPVNIPGNHGKVSYRLYVDLDLWVQTHVNFERDHRVRQS
jgi:hypothetical protein